MVNYKLGTHDVSILDLSDGVFEVLSTDGDTHLGGKDIDKKIMDWIVSGVKEQTGVDVSKDSMAMQRIKEAAEKAKIELSSTTSTEISLPYITAEGGTPKHYTGTLGRSLFEQMISDIVKRVMAPVQSALDAAGLSKSDINEIVLVGGSTRIPAIQKAVEDFFGKTAHKGVNPDEVVAAGASVQGGIMSGDDSVGGGKDILLLDVTPLSLGIETLGGVMTKMIEANTTIPTKKTEVYSTAADNQTSVSIVIYQGERPMAKDNKCLGMFNLDGIAPAPRGVPQLEVSFDIDANGILNVSAKDKATGKEQQITITASSGLSKEEIERMKAEAEANEEADKKVLEQVNKANAADQLAFTIKKSLDEQAKDIVTDEQKADITAKADAVLAATKDKKYDEIDALQEALEKAWEPVVKKLYESQQQNGADPTNGAFNEAFGGQNPFTNPGAGEQTGSSTDTASEAEEVPFEEVK